MAELAFLVGFIVLIVGIVRLLRSEKGSRKRKRSRNLAWAGGLAMFVGFAWVPVDEAGLEQTATVTQEPQEETQSVAAEEVALPPAEVEPEPEPPAEVESFEEKMSHAEVMTVCQGGIKEQLAAPNTAKFPGFWGGSWGNALPERSGDGTFWYWNVEVESQNLYGVPLTSHWSCILEDDGVWTVELVE